MSEYILNHSGSELDRAIEKVLCGYVLPEGNINIDKNGEYDVTEFAKANVNVDAAGKYYATSLNPAADTNAVSFNVGFEPKLFVVVSVNSFTNSSATYYITSFWHCADLTGTGSSEYTGGLSVHSSSGGRVTSYDARSLYSYSDGVVNINDTSHYFKANTLYRVFAMA